MQAGTIFQSGTSGTYASSRPQFNTGPSADERGAVLVLVIFLFIALFAVGALAVDAGNLYRTQLQMQRAADAGVLAGLGYTILQDDIPTSAEELEALVQEKAREISELNMLTSGFEPEHSALQIEPHYDAEERTLTVVVRANVDLYLIDIVPFTLIGGQQGPSSMNLSAEAAGRRAPANIGLVLDYSDSMQCPASGSCNCLQPTRSQTCAQEAASRGENRKVDDLREAVEAFLGYFDESRDRISLTLFNIAAQVEVPIRRSPDQGFDPQPFEVLGEAAPASNTNVCDGLIRSYNDMLQAGIGGQEEAVYVFFSDGAPTAGRFLLAAPDGIAPNHLPSSEPFGEYDYTHYSVEWVSDAGRYPGPSSLLRSGSIPINYSFGFPPSPQSVPDCSPYSGQPPSDSNLFDPMFRGCVEDLGFHLPGMPDAVRAADAGFDWQRQYYHCAVEMADFLRLRQGLVFSVGLGAPEALGQDPYQNINNSFSRKDVLLARIANDFFEAATLANEQFTLLHPEFGYNGYLDYAAWSRQANPRTGRYYPTPDSEELTEIFRAIAQRVLLRLLY